MMSSESNLTFSIISCASSVFISMFAPSVLSKCSASVLFKFSYYFPSSERTGPSGMSFLCAFAKT